VCHLSEIILMNRKKTKQIPVEDPRAIKIALVAQKCTKSKKSKANNRRSERRVAALAPDEWCDADLPSAVLAGRLR
jgi:hypothetical protein